MYFEISRYFLSPWSQLIMDRLTELTNITRYRGFTATCGFVLFRILKKLNLANSLQFLGSPSKNKPFPLNNKIRKQCNEKNEFVYTHLIRSVFPGWGETERFIRDFNFCRPIPMVITSKHKELEQDHQGC